MNTPNGVSFDELLSSVGAIVFAGSETTATLLCGCVYYLATHPVLAGKLAAEIRGTFREEGEIDMVSVNQCTYMLAVLNETMRIYPSAPASFNHVTPPAGCSITGRFVAGNTTVAVNQWSANHSAFNFKRPYEYLPERWLGGEEWEGDSKKAMQPFSVGPRNCIGRALAYAEMRVVLARLVWGFDWELTEGSRGWAAVQRVWMVYQKPQMWVRMKPVVR